MTDAKAQARKGLEHILENLEVTGEAVILDKDGNVKRRLKIRRVQLKEDDSNADCDSTSE